MSYLILKKQNISFNAEESFETIGFIQSGLTSLKIESIFNPWATADIDVTNSNIYIHMFANYGPVRQAKVTVIATGDDGTNYSLIINLAQAGYLDEAYGVYFVDHVDGQIPVSGTADDITVQGISALTQSYTQTLTDTWKAITCQGVNSCKVESSESWLECFYSQTHGKVYFKADKNETTEARRATVTFTATDYSGNTQTDSLIMVQDTAVVQQDEVTLAESEIGVQAIDTSTKKIQADVSGSYTLTASTEETWITATVNNGYLYVSLGENTASTERIGYVTVGGGDGVKSATLKVVQYAYFDTLLFPIWKDTYIKYTPKNKSLTYVSYRVEVEGSEVFRGRMYRIEGEYSAKINDIVANYIKNNIDFTHKSWGYAYANESYINGYIYVSEDDWATESTLEKIYTWDDWSYEDIDRTLDEPSLSCPINGRLCYGMYAIWTKINTSFEDSMTTSMYFDNIPRGGYTVSFDNGVNTMIWYISSQDSKKLFVDSGDTYTYKVYPKSESCYRYGIYYVNKYGGWDAFLFEGKELSQDNYTIHQYQKAYDNNSSTNRGRTHYQKDVKQTWQLSTGYMSDDESLRMDNLLGTTKAYLHDLSTNIIRAVEITDTKVDFKTFRNQGRKFFNYTVNIEASDWDRKRK